MQSNFRLKLLTAAISMAAATVVYASPVSKTAASNAFVALTNQHSNLLNKGDVATGPLAFSQPMRIVVSLNLRNQAQLDSFVANVGKPNTSIAQRSMSPEQFLAQFSPTQAQAQAVADYLTKAGFKNVAITPNRQLVTADGTADTVAAAFNTTFESVRTHDGRNAYHNTSDAMIPAVLQGVVRSVLGLNTVTVAHPFAHRIDRSAAHTMTTLVAGTEVGHNPTDFAKIYSASSLPTASTIAVGNIVSGQMSDVLSDVNAFESENGLPALAPTVVGPGNTGAVSSSGDEEWDLDVQDILGMSGGVKSITLYDAASEDEADLTTDFNLVVTDNVAKVINVSLGYCENNAHADGTTGADDAIFEQAVAQGQTFSVSTGDDGANTCYVNGLNGPGGGSGTGRNWPAASQYVIAAGGTGLYTSSTTIWQSETVWNSDGDATGGGPATYEPMPSWQSGVGENAGATTRGAPDIAFDADPNSGALVIVDGHANQQIGGTSLASPLFVGAWARIQAANGGNLGFAAPLIYKAAATNYATDFHDVTSGNNNGYTAAIGWDYTTGFGSIIVSALSSNVSVGGTPTANFSDTTSGLTATFTDSSTDSGGTIGAYAWTFGDGSTSAVASPSHTYAAVGTYSVTETVTDSVDGKTSSKTASVIIQAPTTAPSISVPANNNDSSYTVSWTSVSGASSYNLEQQFNSGNWSVAQSAATTSWTSSSMSGQSNGTYGYQVQACNTAGCGPWSTTATIVVFFPSIAPAPTTAPAFIVLPATNSTGNYQISWTEVGDATSYDLQRQKNGGAWLAISHALPTSWSASGQSNGTYGYQVRACDVAGCGPWSGTGTVVVNIP